MSCVCYIFYRAKSKKEIMSILISGLSAHILLKVSDSGLLFCFGKHTATHFVRLLVSPLLIKLYD